MNSVDRDLNAKLSEYRKRRHLLTRAYRAAKRAGNKSYRSDRRGGDAANHFLKAEQIRQEGARTGVKVGGIANHENMRHNALLSLAQERSNIARLTAPRPEPTVVTPTPQIVKPVSREDGGGEQEFIDYYSQNLALMNNV